MKITEQTIRNCCDPKLDLKRCGDDAPPGLYFCRHCGRHWQERGGSEPEGSGIEQIPWEGNR